MRILKRKLFLTKEMNEEKKQMKTNSKHSNCMEYFLCISHMYTIIESIIDMRSECAMQNEKLRLSKQLKMNAHATIKLFRTLATAKQQMMDLK